MNVKRSLLLAAFVPGLMAGLCLAVMTSSKPTATFEGHTGEVNDVILSPDGKTIASCSNDGTVKTWDVASRKERATLQHNACSVAFSPDSKTLATGGGVDGKLKLWDVNTGKIQAIFQDGSWMMSIAFSPDGRTLASGNGSIRLWDIATGIKRTTLKDPQWDDGDDLLNSLTFSPDGKNLALGSQAGRIMLWGLNRDGKRMTLDEDLSPGTCLAFSHDGKTLASGNRGTILRLWDVGTGQETTTFQGHDYHLASVAFSLDGSVLASADDRTIILWDVTSGERKSTFRRGRWGLTETFLDRFLPTFNGQTVTVRSVQFSPEGKLVALGSSGSSVLMWELATARK
jgi:WD40 repeat protein